MPDTHKEELWAKKKKEGEKKSLAVFLSKVFQNGDILT